MGRHKIYSKEEAKVRIRASYLVSRYRTSDIEANRGKCDFDTNWFINNILFKPCAHCGKEGWKIIGCNRLDNSKAHTKDNVEPCCWECNAKLNNEERSKLVYQYSQDGTLVGVWTSIKECSRNGFDSRSIIKCCKGKQKTHYGYMWSFIEK